jgi:hypothetical protein
MPTPILNTKALREHVLKMLFEIIDKDVKYSNKIISDLLDYSREISVESEEIFHCNFLVSFC